MDYNCGIYLIICKVDDIIHGIYVGQSAKLNKRWKNHLYHLKKETHYNRYLQSLFLKYELNSFNFSIIEFCSPEDLTKREQYWFNELKNSYPLCNQGDFVDNPMRGRTASEETRKKLSEIRRGKTRSEETRKKMSEARRKRIITDETRKKMSEAHRGKSHPKKSQKKMNEVIAKKVYTKFNPEEVAIIREAMIKLSRIEIQNQFNMGVKCYYRIRDYQPPYDYK